MVDCGGGPAGVVDAWLKNKGLFAGAGVDIPAEPSPVLEFRLLKKPVPAAGLLPKAVLLGAAEAGAALAPL